MASHHHKLVLFLRLLWHLHDDAGDDVLEGFLQLGEAGQAGLHHPVSPLVHLGVLHKGET